MEEIDDHIKIIREINELATTFYKKSEKHEHSSFLEKCNVALFYFFEKKFEDSFLFSALTQSFKGRNNKLDFKIVPGSIHVTKYNSSKKVGDNVKATVEILLKAAHNKETINLTNSLLSKDPPGQDLFFTNEENEYRKKGIVNDNSVLEFTISFLKYNKELDEANSRNFTESNKEKVEEFIKILDLEKLNLVEAFSFQQYAEYLWHYKKIEQAYIEEMPGGKFFIHFIRPSIIELDHNLLLSLATNRELQPVELAFIDLLIYRIVSQTALEKVTEAEKLEFQRNINISTHTFKTEINSSFISQLKGLARKYGNDPKILNLLSNANDLFTLTGIINLLTKLHDKDAFIKAGIKDKLLSREFVGMAYEQVLGDFNEGLKIRKHYAIKIVPKMNVEEYYLFKLYGLYPAQILINNFYKTIFENIEIHGEVQDNEFRLIIDFDGNEDGLIFSNTALDIDTIVPFPNDKKENASLTGNLGLYNHLLVSTNSGSLIIAPDTIHNMFNLKIKRTPSNE